MICAILFLSLSPLAYADERKKAVVVFSARVVTWLWRKHWVQQPCRCKWRRAKKGAPGEGTNAVLRAASRHEKAKCNRDFREAKEQKPSWRTNVCSCGWPHWGSGSSTAKQHSVLGSNGSAKCCLKVKGGFPCLVSALFAEWSGSRGC